MWMDIRVVKLRKNRRCDGCYESMVKGQTVVKQVGKSYDFFSVYLCDECDAFMKEHPDHFGDEWCSGEIGDVRKEFKESIT